METPDGTMSTPFMLYQMFPSIETDDIDSVFKEMSGDLNASLDLLLKKFDRTDDSRQSFDTEDFLDIMTLSKMCTLSPHSRESAEASAERVVAFSFSAADSDHQEAGEAHGEANGTHLGLNRTESTMAEFLCSNSDTDEELNGYQESISDEKVELTAEETAKNEINRGKVKDEIFQTEKVYCQLLGQLLSKYIRPLEQDLILKQKYLQPLFQSIQLIARLHETFFHQISQNYKGNVSMVFIRFSQVFRCYSSYIKTYDTISDLLKTLKSRKAKFSNFVDKVEAEMNSKLISLMILPIQRLPRYLLLLRALLKFTPPDHPEYDDLAEAVTCISETCVHVNDAKRDADEWEKHQKQLAEIASHVHGDITQKVPLIQVAGRKVLKSEKLQFYRKGILADFHTIRVFLFSDMILLADQRWIYVGSIPLTKLVIREAPPIMKSRKKVFQFICTSDETTFTLQCLADEQYDAWFSAVRKAIDVVKSKRREEKTKPEPMAPTPDIEKEHCTNCCALTYVHYMKELPYCDDCLPFVLALNDVLPKNHITTPRGVHNSNLLLSSLSTPPKTPTNSQISDRRSLSIEELTSLPSQSPASYNEERFDFDDDEKPPDLLRPSTKDSIGSLDLASDSIILDSSPEFLRHRSRALGLPSAHLVLKSPPSAAKITARKPFVNSSSSPSTSQSFRQNRMDDFKANSGGRHLYTDNRKISQETNQVAPCVIEELRRKSSVQGRSQNFSNIPIRNLTNSLDNIASTESATQAPPRPRRSSTEVRAMAQQAPAKPLKRQLSSPVMHPNTSLS
eukprot:451213_1